MICPRCQTTIPDVSSFCLSCGARLVQAARLVPVNGGGPAPRAAEGIAEGPSSSVVATPLEASETPEGRQAYALSFRPIADERLRYRVARWVCDRAPAHALSEVQEGLMRGDFLTFLALTPEEAEVARQGIHRLGLAPALLHLTPATANDRLLPEQRTERRVKGARASKGKEWAAVLVALGALFVFGLVVMRLYAGRGF